MGAIPIRVGFACAMPGSLGKTVVESFLVFGGGWGLMYGGYYGRARGSLKNRSVMMLPENFTELLVY